MKDLTDKEIVDFIAKRGYVEITDAGYEDPDRFEYPHQTTGNFRNAISNHIRRVREDKT